MTLHDIYFDVPAFCGNLNRRDESEMTIKLIKKAFDIGEIRYLKAVKHCGKKVPVTMIKRSFTKRIEKLRSSLIDFNWNPFKEPDLDDLFDSLIDRSMINWLINAGGAFTGLYCTKAYSGLLAPSEITDGDNIYGILILIDDDIKNYTDLDTIIMHEYGHVVYQNGMIEKNFRVLLDSGYDFMKVKAVSGPNNFNIEPEEEKIADAFAKEMVGKAPKLLKLATKYKLDKVGDVGFKTKISIVASGFYTILKEGRRF